MTGDELIEWLILILAFATLGVLAPAAIFAWFRRFSGEDEEFVGPKPIGVLCTYLAGLAFIYAIGVYRDWDGSASVTHLFIWPLGITFISFGYAVLVGATVGMFSRSIPSEKKHVMHHLWIVMIFGLGMSELVRLSEIAMQRQASPVASSTSEAPNVVVSSGRDHALASTPELTEKQFIAMLDEFERRYSKVNPSSDGYDAATVQAIESRIAIHRRNGKHLAYALQQAAYEISGVILAIPDVGSEIAKKPASSSSGGSSDTRKPPGSSKTQHAVVQPQAQVSEHEEAYISRTINVPSVPTGGTPNRLPSWEEMKQASREGASQSE